MAHRWFRRAVSALLVFCMLFADSITVFAGGETSGRQLICGLEEHQHTDACSERVLTCGQEEREAQTVSTYHSSFKPHSHDSACYNDAGELICGMIAGKYYHTHNVFCRNEEGKCVCGLEQKEPHKHTEECYNEDGELICTVPTTTHHHTAACFDPESGACTCGKLEIPAFTSSEDNWTTETVDAGHHHTDACYEPRLVCGRQEHTHTDACYAELEMISEESGKETGEESPEENIAETETETEEKTEEETKDTQETEINQEQQEEQTEDLAAESAEEPTETETETVPETDPKEKENETPGQENRETSADNSGDETAAAEIPDDKQPETIPNEEPDHSGTEDTVQQPAETEAEIPEFEIKDSILVKYNGTDETVTVPEGIRAIGTKAFAGNTKITRVVLPDSVETIKNYAFADCTKLEKVIISSESRLEAIGIGSFKNDKNLDISFADGVKVIVSNAFEGVLPEEETAIEETEEDQDEEQAVEPAVQTEEEKAEEAAEAEKTEDEKAEKTEEQPEQAEIPEQPEETAQVPENEQTAAGNEAETDEIAEETATPTDLKETIPEETDPESEEEPKETEKTEEQLTFTAGTIESADTPFLVTISYDGDACIPEGTTVVVAEAEAAAQEEAPRKQKTSPKKFSVMKAAPVLEEEPRAEIASLTTWNAEAEMPEIILYQKTLDISLVSEGEEIEPNPDAIITVSVALPGIEDGQAVEVRHITEEGSVLLESTNQGGVVTFTTSSFSLFSFTSTAQRITSWTSELLENTFFGKTNTQETSHSEIAVSDVTEGLTVLEAFTVTRSSDLWMTLQRIKDLVLGKLESIVLYTVEDGHLGSIVKENISLTDVLRFSLGDLSSFALVKDTGYRHKSLEMTIDSTATKEGEGTGEAGILLDGMMPKTAVATVVDVTEVYADYVFEAEEEQAEGEDEEGNEPEEAEEKESRTALVAWDISIYENGTEYQPDAEHPIRVEITDERIQSGENIELWHIRDDGTKEQIREFTVEDGKIVFEAQAFSVYAVIGHEGGNVLDPRVEFHFIKEDATEHIYNSSTYYYIGKPYPFRNKSENTNPDVYIQTTQILRSGESLELITDPGNQGNKYFYGWYVVDPFVISGTTDDYGIGITDSSLYYTWPVAPSPVSFNATLSFTESNINIDDTIHWSLGTTSGTGLVDHEGTVHVFLAPIFEKYNFVNFMLYPKDDSTSTHARSLMTRKLIALGSSTNVEVKISDVRSTSKDPVHLIFIGWEYNAGTEEAPEWRRYQTVDYSGAERKDEGRDGVYLGVNLSDTSSLDLYPIFVEARWVDFTSGGSESGATYVSSTFRESWGTPDHPTAGMTNDKERNMFDQLPVPTRLGYIFDGWYALADFDGKTGEIKNLNEGNEKDITINYLDEYDAPHPVTIHTEAIKISDGDGKIIYNGTYSVSEHALFYSEIDSTNGKKVLKLYNGLDKLQLYANWIPAETEITIIYWIQNAEDDNYVASATTTVTTKELSEGLNKTIASGSTITLQDLKNYMVINTTNEDEEEEKKQVSIVSNAYLDEVGAVAPKQQAEEITSKVKYVSDEIFFDLNETKSDSSKLINGQGDTTFNVYYSRKIFKLVFHIGHDGYVKNSGQQRSEGNNWLEYMYNDPAVTALLGHAGKGNFSYEAYSELKYKGVKVCDSTYVTNSRNIAYNYPAEDPEDITNLWIIEAKYGAYIGNLWPSPVNEDFEFDEIMPQNQQDHPNDNNFKSKKTIYIWTANYYSLYHYNSFIRVAATGSGSNADINGVHNYMSADLCANRDGKTIINDEQVHHLVAYYGPATNANRFKKYHYLYETTEGVALPAGIEPIYGTNFVQYNLTTWTRARYQSQYGSDQNIATEVITQHTYYEIPEESPVAVVSNLDPQYQLSAEIEGYTLFYSCYDSTQRPSEEDPNKKESHVYFFYRPKQYKLTFKFEEGAQEDWYNYKASLAEANKYPVPEKEGYEFLGWYTNEAGEGEPFDFANSTMPDHPIVLYPVLQVLQYTVKIDPNGGVIDHRINPLQSTYHTANYGSKVGEYDIKREYIKLTDKEQDSSDPTYYDGTKYYYINMQRLGISEEGDWGYPQDLRNAVYVAEEDIDSFYTDVYCKIIDEADRTWWTGIQKLSKEDFISNYASYPYRPLAEKEKYSFMGWYQVINGRVSSMPYNFNEPVYGPVEIRALWRLDGGYYIQYNPYFFTEDEEGQIVVIIGEMEQWQDPENPSIKLYADQSPTHILRAPTNTTAGWVFRGWRVVKANGTRTYIHDGETKTYINWEPIDANNIIYYQPGENFTVDSSLVSENQKYGSVIHMQAYYEPETETERRPKITNLILDSNELYYGGYIKTADSSELPALSHPGVQAINATDHLYQDHPTQILIGDFQSNTAIHLYQYATDKTINGVTGKDLFDNTNKDEHYHSKYTLIGFDERKDPSDPSTGSAYVPKYAADAVIAVQRSEAKTLYAMWEPKIFVNFVNTTGEPITIILSGTGTDTVRVVNIANGEYDREAVKDATITVPAKTGDINGEVRIVLPTAAEGSDNFTATATNDHEQKTKMSVSGAFGIDHTPDYGTGSSNVPHGYDTIYTGTLQLDATGITVTYTEVPDAQVDFDVNGGVWQETSSDYVHSNGGIYYIDGTKIVNNQYKPANPTYPKDPGDPDSEELLFIGWTNNPYIAAKHDFTGTEAATWGPETYLIPEEGESLLDVVKREYIWDFRNPPPFDDTLYAVYSKMVTVTFDLYRGKNLPLHNWSGPDTTTTDGAYVFYRENDTSSYVTYKMTPGEFVPKPVDPIASKSDWFFVSWLKDNSECTNTSTMPNNDKIKKNSFDFTKKVTADVYLYTSWFSAQPQYYTFTVENLVVNGNDDDEFTYNISIPRARIWGKTGTSSTASAANSDVEWGTFSVNLKNNQQYTVKITIKYMKPGSWDASSVEVDVINSDGVTIKNGQVTYANSNGNPRYTSGYIYSLSISQEEKEGYNTQIDVKDTSIYGLFTDDSYSTDEENRLYQFNSKWGSKNETNPKFKSEFTPDNPINGYPVDKDGNITEPTRMNNGLTITFTNTKNSVILPAPTNYSSRYSPYLLLLLFGLMIFAGGIVFIRKNERNDDRYDIGGASGNNSTSTKTKPPGGCLLSAAATPSADITRINGSQRSYRPQQGHVSTVPQVRRNVSCPQVSLWGILASDKTGTNIGKRGDAG